MISWANPGYRSCWSNQSLWKICSSNWIISPTFGVNIPKSFETTGQVDRTVLVPWLVGKVSFHLSYEHYLWDCIKQIGNTQNHLAGNELIFQLHPSTPKRTATCELRSSAFSLSLKNTPKPKVKHWNQHGKSCTVCFTHKKNIEPWWLVRNTYK